MCGAWSVVACGVCCVARWCLACGVWGEAVAASRAQRQSVVSGGVVVRGVWWCGGVWRVVCGAVVSGVWCVG